MVCLLDSDGVTDDDAITVEGSMDAAAHVSMFAFDEEEAVVVDANPGSADAEDRSSD